MNATLIRKESPGSDWHTFWFRTEHRLRFVAGQFIELTVPHDNQDSRGTKRWFTLSSSPDDELISITTRLPLKPSSFKRHLATLKEGAPIYVSEPMGDFVLPLNKDTPLTFVAAGIGCTPFHSMISYLTDRQESRPIRIILAARSENDFVWLNEFQMYDPELVKVLPSADTRDPTSHHINSRLILAHSAPDSQIFVSGPEEMVETITGDLKNSGVKPWQIVGDYFPGYRGFSR